MADLPINYTDVIRTLALAGAGRSRHLSKAYRHAN